MEHHRCLRRQSQTHVSAAHAIIELYAELAELRLQVIDDRCRVPETFILVPPSADGTVHIDRNIENARALFHAGVKLVILTDDNGVPISEKCKPSLPHTKYSPNNGEA